MCLRLKIPTGRNKTDIYVRKTAQRVYLPVFSQSNAVHNFVAINEMNVDYAVLTHEIKTAIHEFMKKGNNPVEVDVKKIPNGVLLADMLRPLVQKMIISVQVDNINTVQISDDQNPQDGCMKKLVVKKKIGQGVYGNVFEIDDKKVVKIIKFEGKQPMKNFIQEVEMMKKSATIGIGPKVFDHYTCCQHFGSCFGIIIMEYINGSTLRDWTAKPHGKKTKDEMLNKIRAAIQKLHAHSIFHNDLHNTNILIAKNGNVKIIDYGYATGKANGLRGAWLENKEHYDFNVLRTLFNSQRGWRDQDTEKILNFVVNKLFVPTQK